ncbi:MAG: hypothetical protein ABIG20_02750 [archaeon]
MAYEISDKATEQHRILLGLLEPLSRLREFGLNSPRSAIRWRVVAFLDLLAEGGTSQKNLAGFTDIAGHSIARLFKHVKEYSNRERMDGVGVVYSLNDEGKQHLEASRTTLFRMLELNNEKAVVDFLREIR